MADFIFKKIGDYGAASLSGGLKFLAQQADGTYAYVLGSAFSTGAGVAATGAVNDVLKVTGVDGLGNVTTMGAGSITDTDNYVSIYKNGAGKLIDHTVTEGQLQSSFTTGLLYHQMVVVNDTVGSSYIRTEYNRVRLWSIGVSQSEIDMTATDISFYGANIQAEGIAIFVNDGAGKFGLRTGTSENIISVLGYTPVNVAGDTMLGNLNGASPTDISNLSGTTSNLQTQINNLSSGLAWKTSVRAATTANITLSGAQTIDGVSVIAGDRVLVKNQSTASQNGIYDVAAGAWTRSTDANTGTKIKQATTSVEEGTVNEDTIFTCTTNGTITIGSTSLTFAKTSATTYTASNGVTLSGNNFVIDNTYFSGAFTLSAGVATIPASYVTNTMLANSSITINGTAIALGASGTVTAAAGTLTGTTLASGVVTSSLTTIGTLVGGAVPASLVTAGTFGAGAYTIGTSLSTPSLIGTSGQLAHTTVAQSSGAIIDFLFTPSAHTGQTASTNTPTFRIASATKTFATGALTAWYANHFQTQTIAFAGASTVTDAFGLYTESPTAGTNATITNHYSLGTSGFVKFGSGLSGIIFRNDVYSNNYCGLYNGSPTPSSYNYFIKSNGTTTLVNAATGGVLYLAFNGTGVVTINATSITNAQALILRAGTASTGTYPLAFQSGANLTTPVNGVMEYNGTNLFFTRAGAVREGILTQSAVTTEVLVSDTSVTVNIGGTTYKLLAKS